MTQRAVQWARSRRQQDHLIDKETRALARATARETEKRQTERAEAKRLRSWVPPTPSERKP